MIEAEEFREWQKRTGMNAAKVAEALGKSSDTISNYRRDGVPRAQEGVMRLAMNAVLLEVEPWKGSKRR